MSENTDKEQPPEPGGEELLTRKEAARLLRRSVGTVDNWRKHEGLPSIKKGRTVYLVAADVKAWLKKGPKRAGPWKKVARKVKAERKSKAEGDGQVSGKELVQAKREGAAEERRVIA